MKLAGLGKYFAQACLAGSRLMVPESRLEEVKKLVVQAVNGIKVGDPHLPETQIEPLVTEKQYQRVPPFGGFEQSGIGREFGEYGLEAYL